MSRDQGFHLFRAEWPDRGVATISVDTEQIWGYLDVCDTQRFARRYPNAMLACDRLLDMMTQYDIEATWALVGGLALTGSLGAADERIKQLPSFWASHIPAGDESSHPLWYRQSFVQRLQAAMPRQDIGLHGGLTHLVWDDPRVTQADIELELREGIAALQAVGIRPTSFVFPRNGERFHHLMPQHGLTCYRGRSNAFSENVRGKLCRAALRIADELATATPPVVWPTQHPSGLWNIPSSLALYPVRRLRNTMVPVKTRLKRFRLGMEAAARAGGIFHFCLHPDNLAESPLAFRIFEDMIMELAAWRKRGDIAVATMTEIAERMTQAKTGEVSRTAAVRLYS